MQNFSLENKNAFRKVIPFLQTTGVTIVSNHLSHFDSAVLYALLYSEEEFRSIAENIFFIAGRLVYLSNFSNLAVRMFHTTLVASPKDMAENESLKKELTRLNLKSYKESKARQKNGQILVLFPEGTRSRTGELGLFHSSVFNYLEGTVVLPISLIGPDHILNSNSFTFGLTEGKMILNKPVYIGSEKNYTGIDMIDPITISSENRKQSIMDTIAKRIASGLPDSMKGLYK